LVLHISSLFGLVVQPVSTLSLSPPLPLSPSFTPSHQDGDTVGTNPWFSAYLSGSPKSDSSRFRVFLIFSQVPTCDLSRSSPNIEPMVSIFSNSEIFWY
jgi:hypothetical protein